MKGRYGLILTGALSLAVLAGCSENDVAEAATQEVKPIAVEVLELKPSRFTQELEFPGVAQPIEQRTIASEAGGKVLSADFEEGDEVNLGDLLIRVDATVTRAQINVIDAQIRSAKREYDRLKKLAAQGLSTPQQVDQVKAQLDQLQASKKQARVGVSKAAVRSPFKGFVQTKFVKKGEVVGQGMPVAQIIDYSTLKIEVTVPESAIAFIKVGDAVKVRFPSTGKVVDGKVMRRGLRVVQPTQTFPVEVHVANEDLAMVPGMRARIVVPKKTIEQAVVVPRDAILEGFAQREAMVAKDIKGDIGAAELRVVRLGPGRGQAVVVTEGLQAGDKLIVRGHRNVVQGTKLRVVRELDRKLLELDESEGVGTGEELIEEPEVEQ